MIYERYISLGKVFWQYQPYKLKSVSKIELNKVVKQVSKCFNLVYIKLVQVISLDGVLSIHINQFIYD